MAQFSNGGKHHEVHLSGKLARKIRDIQQQASIEGRGEAVLAAFHAIVDRLENDPSGFGLRLVRRPAASIPKKDHLVATKRPLDNPGFKTTISPKSRTSLSRPQKFSLRARKNAL